MLIVPSDEISLRRPVWEAMSAFFLDTELDESQLREIAGILRASGYTESQFDDILTTELSPLLYGNLYDLTGVWNGFDVDWIEGEVAAGKHRAIRKWYNIVARWACGRIVREVKGQYWRRVLSYFRGDDPHARM